tara:strand:- start:6992 stop:7882 length:891 start_codon:yes stop_codon:yes gene_type:complete
MSVLDAIAKQYEKNKSGGSSGGSYEQDFSKYFAVRLEDKVDNGESTIRLMPTKKGVHPLVKKEETPFDEGHWHSLKVGGKWRKIYCRKHNDGEHCPLCEVSDELWKSWKETGNKSDKELASQYSAKKFYLARIIDRSKEEDGIKFWRFTHNYKGEGILDKIIPLFTKKGDITDPRTGRDINLIIGRDNKGYAKVTSIMSEDVDVLTDPKGTKAKEWMNDETSWKEIYKAQPLDYVQLIADGETPAWDKNLSKFVAKGDDSEGETSFRKEEPKVSTPVSTPVSNTVSTTDDDDEQPF